MDYSPLFTWIADIISSCNHDFHFEAVDNLIELYYQKTKDSEDKDELIRLRTQRWNEIHFILQ